MLISLTVGKVDAGVGRLSNTEFASRGGLLKSIAAVLLTDDKRLIEFPSILLPPDIHSGSIVDVNVSRNLEAEAQSSKTFQTLQSQILSAFGSETPSTPILRCRNATQTSVVLEWDPIFLATADLRSLTLYRNGSKAGTIPRPFEMTATKISGLAVDCEYTFNLVLRTSAGTYSSEKLTVRTHKMTDLSGVTVTPGVMPPQLRESLEGTLDHMGAKIIETVRIDTTHFVCTDERGSAWEKARELNIPVVVPDWVKGCEREGRIVGVRGYYLNADPKLRQVGPGVGMQRDESQSNVASPKPPLEQAGKEEEARSPPRTMQTPRTEITPPTPDTPKRYRGEDGIGDAEAKEATNHDQSNGHEEDESSVQSAREEASDGAVSEGEADEERASDRESSEHEAPAARTELPTRSSSLGKSGAGDAGTEEGSFDDVKL